MNDLRLIILIIGICIIAFIYFWETGKQRRQQRRQTINYVPPDNDVPNLKITPAGDSETDYASVISDLNNALNKTRQQEDEAISRILSTDINVSRAPIMHDDTATPKVTGDLFVDEKHGDDSGAGDSITGNLSGIREQRIVSLFVTAPAGRNFSGDEIFNAARETGLEFGELAIFHHFGGGAGKMIRPLFSVADMYEPGSFDADDSASRITRGLSLFMCLPAPVDAVHAFELMLNTAHDLAGILGGEVMGPDRKLLNKEHIRSIYKTLNAKA